jgi:hypothetical protein
MWGSRPLITISMVVITIWETLQRLHHFTHESWFSLWAFTKNYTSIAFDSEVSHLYISDSLTTWHHREPPCPFWTMESQWTSMSIEPCWGPVPWVPLATSYGPNESAYDPVPSSGKWLRNQVPCTGYGPTTLGWRGGTTNLKELNPNMIHISHFIPPQWPRASRILPPISPIILVLVTRESQYQASDLRAEVPLDGVSIQYHTRQDATTSSHVRMAIGTRELASVPLPPNVATPSREHAKTSWLL